MKANFAKSRSSHRTTTAALAIAAVGVFLFMTMAAQRVGAQTRASAPSGQASAPMTNKAAHPPGSTASGPAEKKPAKEGAQSGPASAPAK